MTAWRLEPTLRPPTILMDEAELTEIIPDKVKYRLFASEDHWEAWTTWATDISNIASFDISVSFAQQAFSAYVIQVICDLSDVTLYSQEGSGCCIKQAHHSQNFGGFCLFQSDLALADAKMNTYRLSADQFDVMETSYISSGRDFEDSISQTRLYPSTINRDFLQLFNCEHDNQFLGVWEWSCIGYQTRDSALFLTDGYPRFGTYDDGVVMFIDAGGSELKKSLTKENHMFLGGIETLCMSAAGLAMLLWF